MDCSKNIPVYGLHLFSSYTTNSFKRWYLCCTIFLILDFIKIHCNYTTSIIYFPHLSTENFLFYLLPIPSKHQKRQASKRLPLQSLIKLSLYHSIPSPNTLPNTLLYLRPSYQTAPLLPLCLLSSVGHERMPEMPGRGHGQCLPRLPSPAVLR